MESWAGCPAPDLCSLNLDTTKGNVGLAFGLTVAAGLSTTIGAALPLLPCIDETKTQYLSAGLGVSSGVMLYISFAEILPKSRDYLCCMTGADSPATFNGLSVLWFFLGVCGTWALHAVSHRVAACGKHAAGRVREAVSRAWSGRGSGAQGRPASAQRGGEREGGGGGTALEMVVPAGGETAARSTEVGDSPLVGELELQASLPVGGFHSEQAGRGGRGSGGQPHASAPAGTRGVGAALDPASPTPLLAVDVAGSGEGVEGALLPPSARGEEERSRLKAMGLLTGAAIFVHNFPEGMVTFIGALSSPRLGYTLALAVALHNIPEGIAAAAPIYYATGNRKAAFWWGFVSGISEPIGALIGWAALRTLFSPASFGAIFGLVSGMMVYIVVKEALPTAHRYDPKDAVTSAAVFGGMAVMASSLLLFDL